MFIRQRTITTQDTTDIRALPYFIRKRGLSQAVLIHDDSQKCYSARNSISTRVKRSELRGAVFVSGDFIRQYLY